ncbi:MAG: DUF4422 domain-containing protein [Erysipelotrichaceae bacterium]|nr:DUF4422 domain-containing protein [Erysipelotrichaceae bacterium]
MLPKIKVMIACHKKCDVPSDSLYLPVQVGSHGKESIGFQRDDEGDNISEKNPVYCELTGLYWCWKNLDYDYLGLSHYRRYFTLKSKSYQKKHGVLDSVLTEQEAQKLMAQYKVIVPKKRHYYIESVYRHYSNTFSQEQLDETRKILKTYYPEYVPYWDHLMKGTTAWLFNMFLMNKDLVNTYCTWVFDVLSKLEERIDTSSMTPFEKRYAGRISERLFDTWLLYQIGTGTIKEEEVHEIPYLYVGKVDWYHKITGVLKARFLGKKYDKSF